MIQYYINNRPVPRAIARHHLTSALPYDTPADIQRLLSDAVKNEGMALKKCAYFGVLVERR